MRNSLLHAFYLIVFLLSSGCATNSQSTQPSSEQFFYPFLDSHQSSEEIFHRYPPSEYLFGKGQADSEQAAIELARADLAKKIQVRVTALSKDLVREQGEKTEQTLSRTVTTQTNESMSGTIIVDLYQDSDSGLTQAVVALPRAETERQHTTEGGSNPSTLASLAKKDEMVPIWVTSEASIPFGNDTTLAEAAARSREKARHQAVEKAVGAFIKGKTIVYNTTATETVVHSLVHGIVIEEEILDEGIRKIGEQTDSMALFYSTKLRAKVKPVSVAPSHGLTVDAALNRTVFQEGDEVQVAIVPSQNAYVYILNVKQDDTVSMLFPNQHARDNFLTAQREVVFPNETQRQMGIRLRVSLPPGAGKSIEKVKVVVTSKRLEWSGNEHSHNALFADVAEDRFMVTDLMKRLADLDDSTWSETTIPYEIHR